MDTKGANSRLYSLSKYNDFLTKLRKVKESGPSEIRDYHIIKKYDVKQLGSEHRIVTKKHQRILLYAEEVYEIIKKAHIATCHGGRDLTMSQLRFLYENVTKEIVMLYIENCEDCLLKRRRTVKY